jgi:FtsP/CotA-like multicopper oxidase with cupredoxin domain
VQSSPRRFGGDPGIGFVLQKGDAPPRADSVVIPGAPLILTRGEPVRINVVNRLSEPTSIHWHGIELDSYFDGVSGWSGEAGSLSPHIAAGDSFDVRFTPRRAGTFIYHSHFDEERQLGLGLYGPLIVLEPGERYDPETDRIWLLSQSGLAPDRPLMLNGVRSPDLSLELNRRYRIRVINIHSNLPAVLSLAADSVPVRWRAIAKDGAALPAPQATVGPAVLRIGVGETYDFEYTPSQAGTLRIRSVDPAGVEKLAGVVRILAAPARRPELEAGPARR